MHNKKTIVVAQSLLYLNRHDTFIIELYISFYIWFVKTSLCDCEFVTVKKQERDTFVEDMQQRQCPYDVEGMLN